MPAVMLTPSLRSVASITAGYSADTLRVKFLQIKRMVLLVSPKSYNFVQIFKKSHFCNLIISY